MLSQTVFGLRSGINMDGSHQSNIKKVEELQG